MTHEENLAMLVDRLSRLGFHKTNMYEYLDGCAGLESIPYFQRSRFGDDELSCQLSIKRDKNSGLYQPEGYTATLLNTHPVPHDVFGEIDTRELEKKMKQTDWQKYQYGTVVLDEKVAAIIDDIFRLAGSAEAKANDIARRLMLRYWLRTPIEQHLNVAGYVAQYQKSYYFELNKGLDDMQIRAAYNLLCGRSVLKFYEGKPGTYYGHWKMLMNDQLVTFPDFDFMALLKAQPLKEVKDDGIDTQFIYNLVSGDRMNMHLEQDNKLMYLHVNAAEQKIQLYDEEWLIARQRNPIGQAQNQKKINKTVPGKQKRTGRNKGRSI